MIALFRKFLSSAFLFSQLASSCGDQASVADQATKNDSSATGIDSLRFSVTEAPEWSALFLRNKGWFGGDGIFCASKDGKEIKAEGDSSEAIFWFSDSMIGEIKDSLQPGSSMINNSLAILKPVKPDSASITYYWPTKNSKPASAFLPATAATDKKDYYWLGDGFVNQEKNNDLYIFGYRIQNTGAAVFGFREVGNTLIVVPHGTPLPYAKTRQLDIPFYAKKESDSVGTIGCGLLVNTKEAGVTNGDGYLYMYGTRGKTKEVIVGRVKPADIEAFDTWRFWDGKDWNEKVANAAAIADQASNELSVTPLPDGRYALVFQEAGLSRNVGLRVGKTPYGPFGPIIKLWDCSKDVDMDKDLFVYNAKAHPVLSAPDELIISYNVNSFDFSNDIKKMPHLYRPRFIRVKLLP